MGEYVNRNGLWIPRSVFESDVLERLSRIERLLGGRADYGLPLWLGMYHKIGAKHAGYPGDFFGIAKDGDRATDDTETGSGEAGRAP